VIDQAPARKKAASKGPDPQALASKRLADLKASRVYGLGAIVQMPRVILDIVPFAASGDRRLDLRVVKAARPWFLPQDDLQAETATKQGQWISRDPPQPCGKPNPESRWSTRLITPGSLERVFSISLCFGLQNCPPSRGYRRPKMALTHIL
jgi:hypothetical protein